ncbi:hypothetical protein [Streptomyces sp. NPDC003697]
MHRPTSRFERQATGGDKVFVRNPPINDAKSTSSGIIVGENGA